MLNCAVNPQTCRERATALKPACSPKNVLIVGGGVAGCEAARVLALRGHKPVIYEKGSRLGGNLLPGGAPDFKEDDIALADWFGVMLDKLNVPVHLNTELSAEQIKNADADVVILATGSTPKMFSLGADDKVYSAAQVLMKEKEAGEKTVVIGGGLVGCETALWLAQQGKDVKIVEALDQILAVNGPLCHANSEMLERLIPFNGIEVITNAKAKSYDGKRLTVEAADGEKQLACDSVILAVGYQENNALYQELQFEIPELYVLGDAKKVANIMYGIWDAFEVASHI